ncbi:ELKS/Rab6-interacting/CAST family member 1-like isoform X1 [Lates japonicus]|uniref:ELKS/Rab6-interacting/CAST family member 1-like isoform X1 n=1 Tax=Lates japonicus TaxID=270547 RepID=A0AAD3NII0_LATJO|nr:ELKS/Rab6-interacting/CAST family member 1-like isoform X1 [Lates japonicus]
MAMCRHGSGLASVQRLSVWGQVAPTPPSLLGHGNSSSSSTGGLTGSGGNPFHGEYSGHNAAYATGPVLHWPVEDRSALGVWSSGLNPRCPSTMTLGRQGQSSFWGEAAVMGAV